MMKMKLINKIKKWLGYSDGLEDVLENAEKAFLDHYENNPEYYLFKVERKDLDSNDLYHCKNIFSRELNHIV